MTPTDKEILDFMEREQVSVSCYRVLHPDGDPAKDNGWVVSGESEDEDRQPQGSTVREALVWAMKLHERGNFRTRRDGLLAESPNP